MTKSSGINIDVIANDISYIKRDVIEIKTRMENNYVTREEFEPIKKIVYGLVSLILVTVVGAVLGIIIIRP